MRSLLLPLAALALAGGCGGAAGSGGRASVWVTRDEGARVLLVAEAPSGLTALQALDRVADVETRYGGRFVQAVDGLEGSLSARRDWFYFVNGYEADRGASEYTLRPGDVEWWDYRSWSGRERAPVVVGAFPEPFLHGYEGRVRPAAVRYTSPRLAGGARLIGRLLGARSVALASRAAPAEANVFLLTTGRPRFRAEERRAGAGAGSPVRFVFAGSAKMLAADPARVRFRYEVGS